jgi:hypothetical protein
VRLVVLPVLPEDVVLARPSATEEAEVPPVIRSAVVLPVLSPIVEFGFTELADNPTFTCANTGCGIVKLELLCSDIVTNNDINSKKKVAAIRLSLLYNYTSKPLVLKLFIFLF